MKLYVWSIPDEYQTLSYGGGICFAVAESVEQAERVVKSSKFFRLGYEPDDKPGFIEVAELGPPSRIYDLPAGEWHEWGE